MRIGPLEIGRSMGPIFRKSVVRVARPRIHPKNHVPGNVAGPFLVALPDNVSLFENSPIFVLSRFPVEISTYQFSLIKRLLYRITGRRCSDGQDRPRHEFEIEDFPPTGSSIG